MIIASRPSESLPPEGWASPDIDHAARGGARASGHGAGASQPGGPDHRTTSFARALYGLGGELDRGEALSERAIHGGASMTPEGLIALQAGIYRYSEEVDLLSKLVDRGTQAVRTTLQGQ